MVINGVLKTKLLAEEAEFFLNKMVELEGEYRKIFAMGSSIIKNAGLVVESESAKIRGVSVVNLARGEPRLGILEKSSQQIRNRWMTVELMTSASSAAYEMN